MPERTLADDVAALPTPLLVLAHPDVDLDWVPADARVETLPLGSERRRHRDVRTVLVAVPDRDALQRAVATFNRLPKVATLALWVSRSDRPAVATPRTNSPDVVETRARRHGAGWFTAATWERPVAVRNAVTWWSRSLFGDSLVPHGGLRVALGPGVEGLPGLLRPTLTDDPAELSAEDVVVPPDVVIVEGSTLDRLPDHPILPRGPVAVGVASADHGVGPLDERVLNPRGFVRAGTEGAAVLSQDGDRLLVSLPAGQLSSAAARGATEEMVARLREVRSVGVEWPAEAAPDLARAVAGLGMAGVPLLTEPPAWAAALLGDDVVTALAPTELADDERREEHSIVLRRAGLGRHSTAAWRRRLAAVAGRPAPAEPTVSVLLATRRPERLEFALRQVARQRDVRLELVLGCHGFTPDAGVVEAAAGLPITVRVHEESTLFGDVLRDLAAAASGELVLKMDDDDWYGPDFVADLLLARGYSGADLVGVPLEYVYLEPRHETLRRDYRSETEVGVVAGGSTLLSRDLLSAIGGWRPVRRWVDASLLADVASAGGTIYRTHGLGYVFRRGDDGHTWTVGTDHFLTDDREVDVRAGFRPSRLLDPDPRDVPD